MSIETITTLISAIGLLLSFFGMFGWLLHRMDQRFDKSDERTDRVESTLTGRINRVESTLTEQINRVETSLTERINGVETSLTERINRVESSLTERINRVESSLTERINGVERELVEVKVAIARLEGPPRHLLPVR